MADLPVTLVSTPIVKIMSQSLTFINGEAAAAHELAPLAFAGYAHFTAMQIRNGRIRGLDLHLQRLRHASDELFGFHLPDHQVKAYLRTAIAAAEPDISLACYFSLRSGEFSRMLATEEIDVLIKTTPPVTISQQPLAFDLVQYQRHLPHLKHVGEIAKTYFLRQANMLGFDDAAFFDETGRISEATIWNLAFWDGQSVIWPEAQYLPGITMGIVTRQLQILGVPQRTEPVYASQLLNLAVVAMNSQNPAIPLTRLGKHQLQPDLQLCQLLTTAYHQEPASHI